MISAYGIKSVINLRGENLGLQWYDDEMKVSRALGVTHFNVRMTAVRDTDDVTVTQLMETCERRRDRCWYISRAGLIGLGLQPLCMSGSSRKSPPKLPPVRSPSGTDIFPGLEIEPPR